MLDVYISPEVINLNDLNSPYDDYNIDQYQYYNNHLLVFSSNRNSQGEDFDLVTGGLSVEVDLEHGSYAITVNSVDFDNDEYGRIKELADFTNSPCDVLGPQLLTGVYRNDNYDYFSWTSLFYADNCDNQFDIKWIAMEQSKPMKSVSVNQLNTSADDLYPTIVGDSLIYFCSNRNGSFDIFSYGFNDKLYSDRMEQLAESLTKDTLNTVVYQSALSSDGDDKCPHYVSTYENTYMIFASNRSGGFGGFDLYYSVWSNGVWQQPVNFGPEINSTSDEYRPVIVPVEGLENNLMLFSSNRPGGKGGFDLYYTGVMLGPMF